MAIFTASVGVNLGSLIGLAQAAAGFGGATFTFNSVVIASGQVQVKLNGAVNSPSSFTATKITVTSSGDTQWTLTGFSKVITFANAASAFTPASLFSGIDTLLGSNSADFLYGFANNDTILGKGNDDTLRGGMGKDILNGGGGRDIFDFNAAAESQGANADTIQQFKHAEGDDIDLRTIDATPGGANNVFKFAGAASFATYNATHNGGAVRAVMGKVEVDIGGNGTVDMTILTPGVKLVAGDFLL